MSSLTRRNTLAQSVLAAVRGKTNGSMEEERPEDLEADEDENQASTEEDDTAAADPPADDETDPEKQDEDDDPADERQASGSDRIRRAEQKRIHAILTHPKAQANAGLANELAFGSKFYPAADAVALMESSGVAGGRLADRMQGRSPQLGSGGAGAGKPNERQAVVASVGKVIQAMHGRKQKES
jgi:hypothetical protein